MSIIRFEHVIFDSKRFISAIPRTTTVDVLLQSSNKTTTTISVTVVDPEVAVAELLSSLKGTR
jgi:hypothetical protein